MAALFDLARETDVEARRDQMWAGDPINITENRSVLHMALRYGGDEAVMVEGADVMPAVRDVLARIKGFSNDVRDGAVRGALGDQFTDVVNIGIGGSDLGPAMVTLALEPYTRPICGRTTFPMSMARICTTRSRGSIRRGRCSSSRPRPSPLTKP